MSNLIITIIGIALVAVTVLLGIPYLSQTWDDYYIKTKAIETVQRMQEAKAAALLWRADTGLMAPTTNAITGASDCANSSTSMYWCWPSVLNYQHKYLQGDNVNNIWGFTPLLSYGKYGSFGNQNSGYGDFLQSTFSICTKPVCSNDAVVWYAYMTGFGTYGVPAANNLTQADGQTYYSKLCRKINVIMGYSDPPTGVTLNTNLGTDGKPYNVPVNPPVPMCAANGSGATFSVISFTIPF